jgi:hypothetical protein
MQKRTLSKIAWAIIATVLGTVSAARGDSFSVTLTSSGGGVYDYGITLPAGSSVQFSGSDSITISGMSEVTGASTTGLLGVFGWSALSFDSTSVTFSISGFNSDLSNFQLNAPFTWGDFVVDSTAPLGTVSWSGNDDAGTFSGTVGGPVATTPEPSSLFMLLASIALLGLMYLAARD